MSQESLIHLAVNGAFGVVLMILSWFIVRLVHQYDKKLEKIEDEKKEINNSYLSLLKDIRTEISTMIKELEFKTVQVTESIKTELSQIRMDTVLFKKATEDLTKQIEKISDLDKKVIILESQTKALFSIVTGKRRPWEDNNNNNDNSFNSNNR